MARARGEAMAGPSIPDLIREAIDETRDWLKAEIALLRAQILDTLEGYATAALAAVVAVVLALTAFIYLAYAVVLLLTPYLGAPGAAAVVGGALLLAAVAASLYGRARFMRTRIVPARIAQVTEDLSGKKEAER
jgi:hypothetical protein